jgi:hypothetical protein
MATRPITKLDILAVKNSFKKYAQHKIIYPPIFGSGNPN